MPLGTGVGTGVEVSTPEPVPPAQKKQYTPEEAAQLGLGWVDVNNPNYGKAGYVGSEGATAPAGVSSTSNSSTPAPITTQQQVGNTTAPVGGSIAQGAPTTVAQSFQQALVNRLNPQAVSASDPSIAPAIQASRLATQRGIESDRNLLAERNAANGTNMSGGFESQLLGAQQGANAAQSQYEGNLLNQAQQNQDLNTRTAMAQAGGLLGGNANLSQQQALAELSAQLQRESLAQSGQLGNSDINLRRELGQGQLNLGLLSALLGNQYNNNALAQNASQFGQSIDQSGLLGLLGLL